jgi:hypothetical protein
VTAAPRAALDAAVWERSSRAAVRIIVDAVQQRICSAAAIRAELERAGRVRHRRLLGQVLADVDGGAEAVSELAFLAFCRRHDLPTPRLQVRLDSAGRRRYLDADFPRPGRRPLRVEVDGGVHLTLRARWKDTRKDNDAALDGELVLRFPSVAIYTDDPEAVAQLRRGLALSAAERVIAS